MSCVFKSHYNNSCWIFFGTSTERAYLLFCSPTSFPCFACSATRGVNLNKLNSKKCYHRYTFWVSWRCRSETFAGLNLWSASVVRIPKKSAIFHGFLKVFMLNAKIGLNLLVVLLTDHLCMQGASIQQPDSRRVSLNMVYFCSIVFSSARFLGWLCSLTRNIEVPNIKASFHIFEPVSDSSYTLMGNWQRLHFGLTSTNGA